MEVIVSIAIILGTIITWIAYKQIVSKKEETEHLTTLFKGTQTLFIQPMTLVRRHAEKHDRWSDLIFPNVTYAAYYKKMVDGYLDDKIINNIMTAKPSKSIIRSMIDSLMKNSINWMAKLWLIKN